MGGAVMTTRQHLAHMVGKSVYCCCTGYAYAGVLETIGARSITIRDPSIVYETGAWTSSKWHDAQRLPTARAVVMVSQIESIFAVQK